MSWLSDWAKRIEITINNTNIDSDLTHFPVPIVLGTSVGQADSVTEVTDNFTGTNGDSPNTDLWTESDPNELMNIQNNALHVETDGSVQISAQAISTYLLSGDYDIQIDLTEISGTNPPPGAIGVVFSGIQVVPENRTNTSLIGMERDVSGQKWLVSGTTTSMTEISRSITVTKLRLTRVGSTIKGYYWTGVQWEWNGNTAGFTFSETTTDDVRIRLTTLDNGEDGAWEAKFDNFMVAADTIIWDGANPYGFDVSCIFDELGSDANRKKIAVTKADGITEIYAEIELWDQANEKALLWVSKSDLVLSSSTATILYLYYDSTKSDNTTYVGDTGDTAAQNVWLSTLRYNFAQDPSGGASCILDSTSSENNATPSGFIADDLDLTEYGYGITINTDGDKLTLDSLITLTGEFYFSTRIKINSFTDEESLFGTAAYADGRCALWGTTKLYLTRAGNVITGMPITLDPAISAETWFTLSIVRDASDNLNIWINDSNVGSASSISGNIGFNRLFKGPDNSSWEGLNDAIVSFVDLWNGSSPSDAWIKATTYALIDNLISWGSEELSDPALTIDSATNITKSSAMIIGWLINLGQQASLDLYFEWGKTIGYGSTTTPETKTEPATLSANISGLERNQVYHFRLVAEDGEDTWYSDDASFYTLPASPVPQLKPSGGTFITNPFKGRQQGNFVGDINYLNNKPYYNLKDSVKDFYTKPVRYLVNSNQVESAFEKPYLDLEYPQMHLNLPLQDWPIIPWPDPPPGPNIPPGGGGLHDTCLACNLVGSGHHTAKCGNEVVGLIHIFPIRFCTSFPYTNEDCQLVIETIEGAIVSEMPGMFGWNISRYIIVSPLIEKHIIRGTFTDGTGKVCTAEVTQKCDQTDCCVLFPDGVFTGFDEENSDETIDHDLPATLYVLGGCPPFQYQINSDGYFFDYKFTQTKLETNDRYVTVYCIDGTCGEFDPVCKVVVTDYCGQHQKPPVWKPYTYYRGGQFVSGLEGEYRCQESHTSSSNFYQDLAFGYWFFEGSPADELFYWYIKHTDGHWEYCLSTSSSGTLCNSGQFEITVGTDENWKRILFIYRCYLGPNNACPYHSATTINCNGTSVIIAPVENFCGDKCKYSSAYPAGIKCPSGSCCVLALDIASWEC